MSVASVTSCEFPVRELFDIPVSAVTSAEVLDLVHRTIVERGHLQIGVINAAKIVNMQRDRALRNAVLSSHIILADGMSVVFASRILGRPLPERVAGIDLMLGMLDRGRLHQYRVFCLGASEPVLRATTDRIARDYPGVRVVGFHNGYFTAEEEEAVAATIAAAKPDILLVAMTSPGKENFLAKWSPRLGIPVCHGVGGAFDVMAGRVQRAPTNWQRLGLEWLFRIQQEPGRLWKRYVVTNSLFCGIVLVEMFRRTASANPDASE